MNKIIRWYYTDPAPRHKAVTKVTPMGTEYVAHEPIKIIGCCDNEELGCFVTYWIEPWKGGDEGRWAGLKIGQELLAWMPCPEHPRSLQDAELAKIGDLL